MSSYKPSVDEVLAWVARMSKTHHKDLHFAKEADWLIRAACADRPQADTDRRDRLDRMLGTWILGNHIDKESLPLGFDLNSLVHAASVSLDAVDAYLAKEAPEFHPTSKCSVCTRPRPWELHDEDPCIIEGCAGRYVSEESPDAPE